MYVSSGIHTKLTYIQMPTCSPRLRPHFARSKKAISFHVSLMQEATNLDDLYEDEDAGSQHSVHWELEEVMNICKHLQKATLVSSFEMILPRFVHFVLI